ncbi:MAG TPA: hypothetical protein VLN49_15095, partial [Gemmatimonadaceae bacterium]|nr:hypothetical protein [Gemmatimonadaceae bacterium]
FFAAILSPGRWNGWGLIHAKATRFPYENRPPSRAKSIVIGAGRNRESMVFPYEKRHFSEGKSTFFHRGSTILHSGTR